jgi:hypothetical protein
MMGKALTNPASLCFLASEHHNPPATRVFTDTIIRPCTKVSFHFFSVASSILLAVYDQGMPSLHHISDSYYCTKCLHVSLVCVWMVLNLSPILMGLRSEDPFSWGLDSAALPLSQPQLSRCVVVGTPDSGNGQGSPSFPSWSWQRHSKHFPILTSATSALAC